MFGSIGALPTISQVTGMSGDQLAERARILRNALIAAQGDTFREYQMVTGVLDVRACGLQIAGAEKRAYLVAGALAAAAMGAAYYVGKKRG